MRIEGVPEHRAGLFLRLAYWFSRRRFGMVANSLKVTGHNPWVSFGLGAFEFASERARRVESRLKELAQIKAATMIGCPF